MHILRISFSDNIVKFSCATFKLLCAVHPVIHVPNQLVGAPLSTDVTLECNVEAYPRSINYWMRDTGELLTFQFKTAVLSSVWKLSSFILCVNTAGLYVYLTISTCIFINYVKYQQKQTERKERKRHRE